MAHDYKIPGMEEYVLARTGAQVLACEETRQLSANIRLPLTTRQTAPSSRMSSAGNMEQWMPAV